MPAVSKAQQEFMAIQYAKAKAGQPSKTGMSVGQLRDFAATKRKGLPARKSRPAAERIASAVYSRRKGASVAARHVAAARSGNTPKGAR